MKAIHGRNISSRDDVTGRAKMKPDHVVIDDGIMLLVDADGGAAPITLGETPASLAEGWRAIKVYAEASAFRLVELLHVTGATSFWVLDAEGGIVGNDHDFKKWSADDFFINEIRNHVEAIVSEVIQHRGDNFSTTTRSFYQLHRVTRSTLASVFQNTSAPVSIVDLVAQPDEASWSFQLETGSVAVKHQNLMRALHVYIDKQFIDALGTKRLRWPMLTRSELGDIVHCLFFDYSMGVLRVFEPETRLTFYVAFEGADLVPFGIFVPACMTVFGWSTGPQNIAFGRLMQHPGWILDRLRTLLLTAPEAVLAWLQSTPDTTGHFLWPGEVAHLGHYIWNELTGIEKIVRDVTPDCLPKVWDLASIEQSSFYGPLESLYPELRGRIDRTMNSLEDLFARSVNTGTQFVRVSGSFVTQDIRNRITSVLHEDPDLRIMEKLEQSVLASEVPILLLGLRCGTRTLKDLSSFYRRLIDAVYAEVGHFAIVIDGLNSPPGAPQGGTFQVFISGKTSMGPVKLEQGIVKEIFDHCNRLKLTCIDCIGASMKQSLYWSGKASFFVAPWGGGLAKYRWVSNLPGYTLTNAHNLRHPFILSIYHSDRFMEAGTPLYFPKLAWITDVIEAAATGAGWQSDAAFEVDDLAIEDIVSRFADHARPISNCKKLIELSLP